MFPNRADLRSIPAACAFVFAWAVFLANFAAAQINPGFPQPLHSNAASDTRDDFVAQPATDLAGTWIVVWHSFENVGNLIGTDRDVLFVRSTNGGLNWTPPQALNLTAFGDAGSDAWPAIETDRRGLWIVAWTSNENVGGTIGTDYDILFSRSTNDGFSWSFPAPLNSNAASDSGTDVGDAGGLTLKTDRQGVWVCAWQSNDTLGGQVGSDIDVLFSRSTDDGSTWGAVDWANRNATTDSGRDSAPSLASDGTEYWTLAWSSDENLGGTIGVDRDILHTRWDSVVSTWTMPLALNSNATSDTMRDEEPSVASGGPGRFLVGWWSAENLDGQIGSDADILYTRSTNAGFQWSPPGVVNSTAFADVEADLRPMMVAGAGIRVCMWHSIDTFGGTVGSDPDIFYAVSFDDGATWEAAGVFNLGATSDARLDQFVYPMHGGAHDWIAFWQSQDPGGGLFGTDTDIFHARFTLNSSARGGWEAYP